MAATCSSCAPSTGLRFPGIVHGSSGSGASLYLEPLSTVEINNDIVALEQQEHEEVLRILLALSDAFRGRAEDLDRTVDAAAELDVLNARARFSLLVRGVEPKLAKDGRLELRAARHPLLIPAVRRYLRSARDGAQATMLLAGGRTAAPTPSRFPSISRCFRRCTCWSSPVPTPAARPSR